MKTFFVKKNRLFRIFGALLCVSLLLFFPACKRSIEYFDYVSELRNNIFLAETEHFSLRIFSVTKETPYVADGVPNETVTLTEIHLTAPEGDKVCNLSFCVDNHEYGGEMSFDNVKGDYYFSCTLDISELSALPCVIEYGDTTLELNALSVVDGNTLEPETVLKSLEQAEPELFKSMTDKYGFAGEIYLRLIYEDSPYYYVGIIDREERVNAFLINAQTGKILAKRQS